MSDTQGTTPESGSPELNVGSAADAILGLMGGEEGSEQEQPESQTEANDSEAESEEYEAQADDSDEVEQEDSDDEQEEPQTFRVKAAGEEREVTLDELINSYQLGTDYTKKSQAVAEERKVVEAERQRIEEAKYLRDQYAERLQVIEQMLNQQPETENLDYLKENDPIGYAVKVAELSQREKQLAQVQAIIKAKGEAKGTTITNVMPGDKTLADIPAFRASVQRTIDPQLKAVTAADNALENIQDSINTNNFASFRAAQTQFARAISGSGDLSQKELLAAGADPSLLGGTADYLARLFTSTPTLDTQEKIKKTLLAIKKVSTNKAKTEIEAQRKIAYSNPGYDKSRVDQALDFPEFVGTSGAEKKTNTRTLKSGKVVTVVEE